MTLTSPPLTLNFCSTSGVIDDIAHFRRPILGVWHFLRTVLRDAWTELHQSWREHRAIIAALGVCFRIQIVTIQVVIVVWLS